MHTQFWRRNILAGTRLRNGEMRIDSWQKQGTFLLSTAPRPAIEPTHLPILWVPEALFVGGKSAGA